MVFTMAMKAWRLRDGGRTIVEQGVLGRPIGSSAADAIVRQERKLTSHSVARGRCGKRTSHDLRGLRKPLPRPRGGRVDCVVVRRR